MSQFLVVLLCVLGMVCSVLTFSVLCRKDIRSPCNTLIMSLAATHFLAVGCELICVVCFGVMPPGFVFHKCLTKPLATLRIATSIVLFADSSSKHCIYTAISIFLYICLRYRCSVVQPIKQNHATTIVLSVNAAAFTLVTWRVLDVMVIRNSAAHYNYTNSGLVNATNSCYIILSSAEAIEIVKDRRIPIMGLFSLVTLVILYLFSILIAVELRKVHIERQRILSTSSSSAPSRSYKDMVQTTYRLIALMVFHSLTEVPRFLPYFLAEVDIRKIQDDVFGFLIILLLVAHSAAVLIVSSIQRTFRVACMDIIHNFYSNLILFLNRICYQKRRNERKMPIPVPEIYHITREMVYTNQAMK